MFYCTQNQQYIQEGTAFEINDVQYPANWLNLSTPEEKTEIGLEEVVATNSPANDQYYWVSTELNGATLTYINTPKDLTGVKTNAFTTINATAYSILQPSDWMVIKATETSTPVNADWNNWRASIRATADTTRTAITSAADVDAVATIMTSITWAKSPSTLAAEQTTA
jgi:hypothetical protein